jgi:multidrug efflux pump subunit AcrA (membrane-fusion protein)
MMRKVLYPLLALLAALGGLAGCSGLGGGTPQPLPTVVLGPQAAATAALSGLAGGGVTASGVVAAGRQARMAFAAGGLIEMSGVAVGDSVQAGQTLARLAGSEQLQAALSAAELEVLAAEQTLKQLEDDLPEAQVVALQALRDARDALRDAQQRLTGLGAPSEPIDIEVARSNVALAKRALEQAEKDFKPYENKPESNLRRAALLSKLSDAQKRYDNAVEQLNRLTGVIVPEFDRQQAQTDLDIAEARLTLAQERYIELQGGPEADAVALAEARLQNARDRVAAAAAALKDLELAAPFAGLVSDVYLQSGEWAMPGQAVLALADLSRLHVETTDLSERDIPRVEIGQTVRVLVKALGTEVTGRVVMIAPFADTLGGDVVYKTTIELDSIPAGLRAGMSVEVEFGG